MQLYTPNHTNGKKNILPAELPFVSVVMPVRNEADFIERSLGAVLTQDYPHDRMEVLIADGMSTDNTREVITGVSAKHDDLTVTVVDNPGKIVPTGLNAVIPLTRGDIIIRVDGHCEIAPDYVTQCVRHLLEDEVDGVGGPIDTIGQTPLSEAIAVAMSSAFGVGGSAFRTIKDRSIMVDTVAFPAYTREVLELAGAFDEELVRNQDDEYNYRLRGMGRKLLLAQDVRSRYYSRGTLEKVARQYYQYGYWKVRVMQKHPQQMRPRQFVPPLFVMALLGSALLGLVSPWGRRLLLAVVGSYSLANLAASYRTAQAANPEHFTRLPVIFAILHISYGLGFLVGLVKFRNRWGDRD
jgi:succinoglycan biosynthesis protein ExoA